MAETKDVIPTCPICGGKMFASIQGGKVYRCKKAMCEGRVAK